MKTANELKQEFYSVLWELQNTNPATNLKEYLQVKLEILLDILEDELDDDFLMQAEKIIKK